MFASLSDALEVGLDLALELQSEATSAGREWILNDITSQLAILVSYMFSNIFCDIELHGSRVIYPLPFCVTHFLLSTLIARSLDARLSPALCLFMVVIFCDTARTALELDATALPFEASTRARSNAGCRTGNPTTHGPLTTLHADGGPQNCSFPAAVLFLPIVLVLWKFGCFLYCSVLRLSGLGSV